MARGRMIDKRINMSKKLGKVTDKAKVLYFMIYPNLDREGRISFEDIEDLKDDIIPKFKNWSFKKIGSALNELADIGLIQLYPNGNNIAMEFERFKDFQAGMKYDREAKSKIKPPGEGPEQSGDYRINPEKSPLRKEGSLSLSLKIRKEGRKCEGRKEKDIIKQVLSYLNEKTGKNFKTDAKGHIEGRLNDGYSEEDLEKVIDIKTSQWINDEKMDRYLRPITLFCPSKFEGYLNERKGKTQEDINVKYKGKQNE